jgi:hypothetical protein
MVFVMVVIEECAGLFQSRREEQVAVNLGSSHLNVVIQVVLPAHLVSTIAASIKLFLLKLLLSGVVVPEHFYLVFLQLHLKPEKAYFPLSHLDLVSLVLQLLL